MPIKAYPRLHCPWRCPRVGEAILTCLLLLHPRLGHFGLPRGVRASLFALDALLVCVGSVLGDESPENDGKMKVRSWISSCISKTYSWRRSLALKAKKVPFLRGVKVSVPELT
jgi:hypothetical protein